MKKNSYLTLQEYLYRRGVQQTFIAKQAGVSKETINRILRRGFAPTLKLAIAIEKATNGEVSVYSWDMSKGARGINPEDND